MSKNHYDYIIAGAGASGLSLAWKMLHSPLVEKKILIADQSLDAGHDKTWCFWHNSIPPFADIIHHKWEAVEVGVRGRLKREKLQNYPYYCLRSIDFKEKIISELKQHASFDLLETTIQNITGAENGATLSANSNLFTADYIFQSCFTPPEIKNSNIRYPLIQHFLGWDIKMSKPLLDPSNFTLMDFDGTFHDGLAFIYMLPWTKQEALIEYTIFSREICDRKFYEDKIALYLHNRFNLMPLDYTIIRKESGQIPMQDRPPVGWYAPRVLSLGTAGGLTKPTTGYTFDRIQQQTDDIVQDLLNNRTPQVSAPSPWRYRIFDLWLLEILYDYPDDGLKIFQHFFKKNSMDDIFRFLNEDTSLLQDLKIMGSVPAFPFLRAMWKTKSRLWSV